ncbi:hypothetical protein MHB50_20515 [Siminovitchia sp. FSL H7-0308]|uniref:Uncharacterized protein n=1 Tax=Siminovitchia thermophila TaxID=1245522 RepID=A0ABS2R5F8_9BACI|nr:hypothetical protein [Siminovitchia thermophila]MBM7714635.1 hypothetical protein [Siminovitchia thermophila]
MKTWKTAILRGKGLGTGPSRLDSSCQIGMEAGTIVIEGKASLRFSTR